MQSQSNNFSISRFKILPSSLVGWQPRHNKIGLSTGFQKFLDFIWIRISSILAKRMRISDSFNQITIKLNDAWIKIKSNHKNLIVMPFDLNINLGLFFVFIIHSFLLFVPPLVIFVILFENNVISAIHYIFVIFRVQMTSIILRFRIDFICIDPI